MNIFSHRHPAYPWFLLITVMIGTFMVILDGTIVNVAIPSIMAAFGVTLSEVVWVSTAYLIALSVLLAVSGWLADHFGAKRIYLMGLAIFGVSSYLCGISWNLHALIFFRVIQGVGGGILIPVGMTLFTKEFPPEKRAVPMGYYSIAIAAAISLGPTFGGYLIETINWGWIFFVNVPVGIFAFLASWVIIKDFEGKKVGRFDIWGLLALSAFLISLIVGISSGNAPWNAEGWTSRFTLVSFAITAGAGILFFWVELNFPEPIVDLRVFKNRNFLLGNIVLFIFSFTLFGSSFLLPLYLQNGLEYSQIWSGLILLPIGLMQGLFGAFTGWLTRIISARFLVIIGIILIGISYQLNSGFTLYTEQSTMLWLFAFRGFAMALMFTPLITLTLATIPEEKMAQATGLFSVQRQIGAALGVSVFETIFTYRQTFHGAMYGQEIDPGSPIFDKAQMHLQHAASTIFGVDWTDAAEQARQVLLENINKHVFVQAIDDNILIAGLITFFSCIPLFFIRTGGVKLADASQSRRVVKQAPSAEA